MKKGLLSILAASAVLVGCQNYDDQFDALNTQITSLKSTVDGLAGRNSIDAGIIVCYGIPRYIFSIDHSDKIFITIPQF